MYVARGDVAQQGAEVGIITKLRCDAYDTVHWCNDKGHVYEQYSPATYPSETEHDGAQQENARRDDGMRGAYA